VEEGIRLVLERAIHGESFLLSVATELSVGWSTVAKLSRTFDFLLG
jgi:hypothetical protein